MVDGALSVKGGDKSICCCLTPVGCLKAVIHRVEKLGYSLVGIDLSLCCTSSGGRVNLSCKGFALVLLLMSLLSLSWLSLAIMLSAATAGRSVVVSVLLGVL